MSQGNQPPTTSGSFVGKKSWRAFIPVSVKRAVHRVRNLCNVTRSLEALMLTRSGQTISLPLYHLAARIMRFQARFSSGRLPLAWKVSDSLGVSPVLFHFYQPLFDPHQLDEAQLDRPNSVASLTFDDATLKTFVAELGAYQTELSRIPATKQSLSEPYFENSSFNYIDCAALYAVIRHFKPKLFMEIGCGNSTLFARKALLQNASEGMRAEHLGIEPFGPPWLESLSDVSILPEKIENLPLAMFDALGPNDILFIDSTHVVRCGGDVVTEYCKILPRLRPGVIVHIHDIWLPFDYPKFWFTEHRRYWTEQYLLAALLANSSRFKVIFPAMYLVAFHPELLFATFPDYKNVYFDKRFNSDGTIEHGKRPNRWAAGGSFWLKVNG
ncbi:MAG: class I SAM-dependent methyltransferase [Candidatus Aminicenantales bacterium]